VLAGEQQGLPEEEENYLAGGRRRRWQMAEILADIFKRMNENPTCNNNAEDLASGRTSPQKTPVVKRVKVAK
jgi:hypothetical protein